MKLSDFTIDIIFNLVKGLALPNIHPILLTFFNAANEDITNTLFGFSNYSIATDKWTTATTKQIQNNTSLVIGTTLVNYSGDLTLQLATSTGQVLLRHTYAANLTASSVYTILSNAFIINLPNLSTPLSNFLLNYLFRGVTTGKPTVWHLELQTTASSPYQSRIQLDCDKFSEPYLNEIGQRCVSYGKYEYILTNSNQTLKYGKLFTAGSGGVSWFDTIDFLPHLVYAGRSIEIFNNTLVIAIPPIDLNSTYLATSDSDYVLCVDFDGRSINTAIDKAPAVDTVAYNPVVKLFKAESASMGASETVEYTDVNLSSTFTIEMFVYFTTNPATREVTFIEKQNSFRVFKTALGKLAIDNQAGRVFDVDWVPVINTWYHIFVTRSSTSLRIRVNNSINEAGTIAAELSFASNSNPLKVNPSNYPILGYCNGVYIVNGVKSFASLVQPIPARSYDWKYISGYIWANLSTAQWSEYCRI